MFLSHANSNHNIKINKEGRRKLWEVMNRLDYGGGFTGL